MGYSVAGTSDVESVVPEEWGGMWFLRDALDCERLGVTLLELDPGGKGKEHDHGGTDHEEVYLVVDGELTVALGPEDRDAVEGGSEDQGDVEGGDGATGEREVLGAGEAVRVDPGTTRQLFNRGDERVRVVVAGAP